MLTMVRLNVYEPLGWLLKYVIVQTVGLDAWWARMVSIVIHFAAGFVLAKVSALVLDIDYMMTELKPLQIHQMFAVVCDNNIHVGANDLEFMPPRCLEALVAIAFFICMVMPVSGLIQHGIITAAANRYAYLPTIIIVPYGGWVVACCLFQESNSQQESDRLTAPAWDTPEREISHNSRRSKQLKEIKSSTQIHTSKSHVWGVYVLVVGTLLSISTDLLGQWRNEDSLFQVDPADWKILGQRSEYLLHAGRCTPDDTECRQLWILAHEFSPRGTLKSQLYRLHLLVALGRVDHACDGYLKLLKHHPGNSSVHNNAAVCFAFRGMMTEARREFSRALLYPGIAETLAAHARNSREFDQWEAKSRHHGLEESSGFGRAMTY
ncbi:Tetratricopeptide-like helical domain [Phytophthora cactorum]|nr:Tetratricopeptide-like helical domain [Phytophthora cactorum]